ncbi:tetratricopeptide repeat protein [Salipiger sp.]|uniref:tetratricopeptide repeat protein n=1 Tax=Salipiger sp. TaxID=2078585 RepID=UPI003A97E799
MFSIPLSASAQEERGPDWQMAPVPAPLEPEASPDLPTEQRIEALLEELSTASSDEVAARLERNLFREWSKSGSAAMDLLLKRGRDALEVGEVDVALEHLTALTDHAPDFAEGWHVLALAYYQDDAFGPAMDALEHVLALNPRHFGALRGVAAIQEQIGRPVLAYQAYSRVQELRPFDENVTEALKRLAPEVQGVTL